MSRSTNQRKNIIKETDHKCMIPTSHPEKNKSSTPSSHHEIGPTITTSSTFSTSPINLLPGRMLLNSPKPSKKWWKIDKPANQVSVASDNNSIARPLTNLSDKWLSTALNVDCCWWEWETNEKWLWLHMKQCSSRLWATVYKK